MSLVERLIAESSHMKVDSTINIIEGMYRLGNISLKFYGRVMIDRVVTCTEDQIVDEQSGFKSGKECVDVVMTLKNLHVQ